MRLGPYRLRAPLWSIVLTILAMALFARLGVWQLHRAAEKKAIIAARQQAAKAHPTDLNQWLDGHTSVRGLYDTAVSVRGRPDTHHQLLLDNQTAHGIAGYDIWTPVHLSGARQGVVLVNRGWVPMNPDRSVRPDPQMPDSVMTLRGILRSLPKPGLRLGKPGCVTEGAWPRIVDYPRLEDIRCLFDTPLVNGVMLLSPSEPYGFRREWDTFPIKPIRHYSYAVQWFAMALAVLVVFVVVNSKRDGHDDDVDER